MAGEGDHAPGWSAIDAALAPIYHGREPLHYAPPLPLVAGGNDPLDGISVYTRTDPPHFHFVSYGFTELYEKQSDDPEVSGFGFELTFRLARAADEDTPPPWALNLLQNLARYVFKSGNTFSAGHKMNLNGPIALGHDTAIAAIAFTTDPELGVIESPFGIAEIVQIVGITFDEYELAIRWDTAAMLEVLAQRSPLFVTDLGRTSMLEDAELAAVIAGRERAEGSSQTMTFAGSMRWELDGDALHVTVGAAHVLDLPRMVRGRIAHGREFAFAGSGTQLVMRPATAARAVDEGERIALEIDPALAAELEARLVEQKVGTHRFDALPGFVVEVEPTLIRDQAGRVAKVVGLDDEAAKALLELAD